MQVSQVNVCDTGTLTTVELTLSGVKMPRGFVDTIFEDIVRRSLHQVLTFVSVSVFSCNKQLSYYSRYISNVHPQNDLNVC